MDAGEGVGAFSARAFEEVAEWIRNVGGAEPFLVGIGGPGGCGKTTLARWLRGRLDGAEMLPLDDFRLPRPWREERGLFGSHPRGNDLKWLRKCLLAARRREAFERPVFHRVAGRAATTVTVPPCRILICDGEIAAHLLVRDSFDCLILVDAHWRTQLNTRLTRDVHEHHGSLEKAIEVFLNSNLRDYPTHSKGAAQAADFVLYRSSKDRFSIRKRPDE